jgi:hypothetical protein
MSGLRDVLRQQIEGIVEPEPPSGSARLAEFARQERAAQEQIQARREAEAAAAAAPPPPATLVEELMELIGHQEPGEHPALNDPRLLQIAAGSQDAPRSVREQLSGLLRGMWDQREQGTD